MIWPPLVAAAFIGLASSPAARAAVDTARAVEEYLLEQMRLNHIPSIAVAIVRNGRTEMLRSWGTANLEWDAAATVGTAYQLASATKPLTGTALMLLVQDGTLSLDDRVTTHLPTAPEEWQRITVRHLVTHSSGITDDLGPGDPATAEEAVRRAASKPLEFEPGSRSAYGIGGYAVLQHIIERVSGVPFPRFLRERLLDPLGMTGTRFDNASNDGPFRVADVVARRAGVYSWESGAQRIFWFHFGAHAYTAGGLLSTAEDLARWAAALDSDRLLSEESRRRMFAPGDGDQAFGVGWVPGFYRGRRTVGHSGGPALADILRFPDDRLTIIVLANQSRMYPYLAQGVADLVVPAPAAAAPAAIEDTNPALTSRLNAFLVSVAEGDIPEEAFTAEALAGLVPQLHDFLTPYARSLGPPTALHLLAESTEGGMTVRVYRVLYGSKPITWTFHLAPDGKIASLRPVPE